jgi:hypothetical protein
MNTKLDHEKYMRDVADKTAEGIRAAIYALTKNCVSCEFFDQNKEFCNLHKAKPPAKVIVIGCDKYENEIPF